MSKSRLSRREFLRMTAGVVGATVVASCTPSAPPAPKESAGEAPAVSKAVEVEINGWKYQGGRDEQKLVFDMLEKDNPGIKITATGAETSDWYVQVKSRFQSGDVPDVILMEPGAGLGEYSPHLLPLNDFIAKSPEVQEDKYFPTAWNETMVGDQVFGLPGFLGVQSPWYNVTMLEELGIDSPPSSYEELKAVTQAARDAGHQPFLVGAKDQWHLIDALQHTIHAVAPGKLYECEAGTLAWTDPDMVKALEIWGELFTNGVFEDGALGVAAYPDADDMFRQGKAVMLNMGSWATSELLEGLSEGLPAKFMPMYYPDVSSRGAKVATAGVDQLYCIPKAAKDPEASWQVVKWMTQFDVKYTKDAGALPSRKEAVWPEALSKAKDQEHLKAIQDFYLGAFEYATRRQLLYAELRAGLADAGAAVASGQMTAADALADLEKISQDVERS